MMKRNSLLFMFFLVCLGAGAQELTKFEKAHWVDNDGAPAHLFALFAAVDPAMTDARMETFQRQLDLLIDRYRDDDKFRSWKPAKQIKTLYKETHDAFLKKYELINHFDDVFEKGYYNCVSATALYAFIFEELDIPYQIKQKPNHVYLLAYPETDNILVETTNPIAGYTAFSGSFKTQYINNLTEAKLISNEERAAATVDELFDKHYFLDENINMLELAGLQYANDAYYALERGDRAYGLKQLTKAYSLFPSETFIPFLIGLNSELLYEAAYDDLKKSDYFVQLASLDTTSVTREMMLHEFMRICEDYLIKNNNPEGLEEWCSLTYERLDYPELESSMRYHHDYERGRVLYNSGNFDMALAYFMKCHKSMPENVEILQIVTDCVSNNLQNMPDQTLVADSLEQYARQIPALMENMHFKSMLVNSYLYMFMSSYDLEDIKEGERYRSLFETNMEQGLQVDVNNIGRAYAIAGTYYFRKGNKTKALQYLNQGLERAPNNRELLIRKQMIR